MNDVCVERSSGKVYSIMNHIKGTVHQKIKIVSVYSPLCHSKTVCCCCFFSVRNERRYFEECELFKKGFIQNYIYSKLWLYSCIQWPDYTSSIISMFLISFWSFFFRGHTVNNVRHDTFWCHYEVKCLIKFVFHNPLRKIIFLQ